MLTFLAKAAIDSHSLKANVKASFTMLQTLRSSKLADVYNLNSHCSHPLTSKR
jgi:hypothetical protein